MFLLSLGTSVLTTKRKGLARGSRCQEVHQARVGLIVKQRDVLTEDVPVFHLANAATVVLQGGDCMPVDVHKEVVHKAGSRYSQG